jgi:hypothetical protein
MEFSDDPAMLQHDLARTQIYTRLNEPQARVEIGGQDEHSRIVATVQRIRG